MSRSWAGRFVFGSLALTATGCSLGLVTPEMDAFHKDDPARPDKQGSEWLEEKDVVAQIKCELHDGYNLALADERRTQGGTVPGVPARWLSSWGATVNLDMAVDEKGALNPGVTFIRPFSGGHSFSFGLGATLSSEASRKETVAYTYSFADFDRENKELAIRDAKAKANGAYKPPAPCSPNGGLNIRSDLKIEEFIRHKAMLASVPGLVSDLYALDKSPYGAFNYDASFVVVYGGGMTPSWHFVDITGNPSSPLLNSMRTRTDHILITLGKVTVANGKPVLSPEALAVHNANLIGQAVASALQNQAH